jgi:hypothetical protein
MEKLNENDVEILDSLLEKLVKEGDFFPGDLTPLSSHYLSDIPDFIEQDYRYFLEILEKCELVKIDRLASGAIGIVHSVYNKTKSFHEHDGFKSVYEEQQKILKEGREINELNLIKLRWDVKVSKFLAKTQWWPLIISLISMIIAIVALVKCK